MYTEKELGDIEFVNLLVFDKKYNFRFCGNSTAPTTWDRETNTLNETLTYDENGNIKTLVRKRNNRGLSGTTITSSAQTIDELSYIYQAVNGGTQNSNMLIRVNEAVTGATGDAGFKNGASSDTEFAYSTWGSQTRTPTRVSTV